MEKKDTLSRRDFVTAGAAAAAVIAAPAIVGAQSKSGNRLPVIGQGEYMYEVEHDWGMASLPSTIKYGNTHSVIQDSNGFIYVHHTVHADSQSPDSVVVFDNKGKFVRSWGAMFRGGAHGMHLQKEGNTEYLYFCDEKHGIVTKRTLKGEEVWTMGYPQASPIYQKGPGATGPGGAAGLNYRPTNIAIDPKTLDFWIGDGYGSYYMFHYKQKTSTSYPELVKTFGGPPQPPAGAAPTGAGAAKGKGDGAPAPLDQAKGGGAPAGAGGGRGGRGGAAAPPPLETTNNPHGNWIDTRNPNNPMLLIADRGNRRIVRYTLDDRPVDVVEGTTQPCHFHQYKDLLVVPDLASRVHLVTMDNRVITIGEGENPNNLRTTQNRADFRPGRFVAPHGACFDKDGNIFVVEWVEIGRVTKLRRV
jgi:hypothetical protein